MVAYKIKKDGIYAIQNIIDSFRRNKKLSVCDLKDCIGIEDLVVFSDTKIGWTSLFDFFFVVLPWKTFIFAKDPTKFNI